MPEEYIYRTPKGARVVSKVPLPLEPYVEVKLPKLQEVVTGEILDVEAEKQKVRNEIKIVEKNIADINKQLDVEENPAARQSMIQAKTQMANYISRLKIGMEQMEELHLTFSYVSTYASEYASTLADMQARARAAREKAAKEAAAREAKIPTLTPEYIQAHTPIYENGTLIGFRTPTGEIITRGLAIERGVYQATPEEYWSIVKQQEEDIKRLETWQKARVQEIVARREAEKKEEVFAPTIKEPTPSDILQVGVSVRHPLAPTIPTWEEIKYAARDIFPWLTPMRDIEVMTKEELAELKRITAKPTLKEISLFGLAPYVARPGLTEFAERTLKAREKDIKFVEDTKDIVEGSYGDIKKGGEEYTKDIAKVEEDYKLGKISYDKYISESEKTYDKYEDTIKTAKDKLKKANIGYAVSPEGEIRITDERWERLAREDISMSIAERARREAETPRERIAAETLLLLAEAQTWLASYAALTYTGVMGIAGKVLRVAHKPVAIATGISLIGGGIALRAAAKYERAEQIIPGTGWIGATRAVLGAGLALVPIVGGEMIMAREAATSQALKSAKLQARKVVEEARPEVRTAGRIGGEQKLEIERVIQGYTKSLQRQGYSPKEIAKIRAMLTVDEAGAYYVELKNLPGRIKLERIMLTSMKGRVGLVGEKVGGEFRLAAVQFKPSIRYGATKIRIYTARVPVEFDVDANLRKIYVEINEFKWPKGMAPSGKGLQNLRANLALEYFRNIQGGMTPANAAKATVEILKSIPALRYVGGYRAKIEPISEAMAKRIRAGKYWVEVRKEVKPLMKYPKYISVKEAGKLQQQMLLGKGRMLPLTQKQLGVEYARGKAFMEGLVKRAELWKRPELLRWITEKPPVERITYTQEMIIAREKGLFWPTIAKGKLQFVPRKGDFSWLRTKPPEDFKVPVKPPRMTKAEYERVLAAEIRAAEMRRLEYLKRTTEHYRRLFGGFGEGLTGLAAEEMKREAIPKVTSLIFKAEYPKALGVERIAGIAGVGLGAGGLLIAGARIREELKVAPKPRLRLEERKRIEEIEKRRFMPADILIGREYVYEAERLPSATISALGMAYRQETKKIQKEEIKLARPFPIMPMPEVPPPPKPPKPPKPVGFGLVLPDLGFRLPEEIIKPKIAGYHSHVKSKGKWMMASRKSLSRGAALDLGAETVDKSASARFKIVPTKKKAEVIARTFYFPRTREKFRGYKIKKRVKVPLKEEYIERTPFRIDTPGEVRGISAKGWLAQRRKAQARRGMLGFSEMPREKKTRKKGVLDLFGI